MGLLDKVTSKVQKEVNKFNKYVSQAEAAAQEFDNFRSDINRIFDTSPDTLLSDMRSMSSGAMKKFTGSWIDDLERGMQAVGDTKALVNRVNSALGVDIGKNLTNVGNATMAKLGLGGSTQTALNNALNYIAGSSAGKTISNAFNSAFIKKVNTYDPVSTDIDLSELVITLAEDLGMIANKFRGVQYARKYHFIERPEMEIDRGGRYRSYVFFTRPDCNLVQIGSDGGLQIVPDVAFYPELLTKVVTDMPLYSELCLTKSRKSNLWPLLSNYAKEVAPIRLNETAREGTKNMHGVETPIPGAPEYNGVDISVTFGDNARGDIAKIFDMVQEYKHFVSKEQFPMIDEYIKFNACDYAMSIYIVTVDADWSIVGFGVGINCVPVEAPAHFTQHKYEGFSKQELLDEFTITFKCKTYKPYRPLYFDYFNRISGFDPESMIDTKGCAFTLQAASRAGTGSVGTNRKSVFTPESQAVTDFRKLDSVTSTVNLAMDSLNIGSKITGGGNLNPNGDPSLAPGNITDTGNAKFFGRLPLPGVFEMLALKPGIYRALNMNEPNRPIFKLGFSY